MRIVILISIIVLLSVLFGVIRFIGKNDESPWRLLSNPVFLNAKVSTVKYDSGLLQESLWTGWVYQDSALLEEKIKRGDWIEIEPPGSALRDDAMRDFDEGVIAFTNEKPTIDRNSLILLVAGKKPLSHGELRCVASKTSNKSYAFSWGNF